MMSAYEERVESEQKSYTVPVSPAVELICPYGNRQPQTTTIGHQNAKRNTVTIPLTNQSVALKRQVHTSGAGHRKAMPEQMRDSSLGSQKLRNMQQSFNLESHITTKKRNDSLPYNG